MFALTECRIFTGEHWLEHTGVIINNGIIHALVPEANLDPTLIRYPLQGAIVSAGFIDLQLNGCGGVMFNSEISAATLGHMQRTNLRSGTTSFLPTLITSSDQDIRQAVSATTHYMAEHRHQVLGLHLEGPYLNLARKGIHPAQYIRSLDAGMLDFLCQHAEVIRKVTLAPECHDSQHIRRLAAAGILVAIGHTDASYEQAIVGFAAGIRFATHLYNAMTPTSNGRTPGVVGAIYDNEALFAGIIADGVHVHDANIRLAHRVMGSRLCLVTDATAAAGADAAFSHFDFCGTTVWVRDGQCVDEQGTLGGSALTMVAGVQHLVNNVGLSLTDALHMATLAPAKALGIEEHLGSVAVGKVANLVILSCQLQVINTLVNGKFSH